MVEQIYNIDVLRELTEVDDDPAVSIMLTENEIENWKMTGKFKFLKRQLRDIPNLRFACMKLDDGACVYHFLPKSVELKDRIMNMLRSLVDDEFVQLVKCKNSNIYHSKACYGISGEATVCQLF